MKYTTPLFNRENARRMARTLTQRPDNQNNPQYANLNIRRMKKGDANLVSAHAAMPSWMRTARVESRSNGLVFKIGTQVD